MNWLFKLEKKFILLSKLEFKLYFENIDYALVFKVFHTLKCTFKVHCFLDTHSNVWCGMLHGLMGGRVIADIFICLFTLMVCDHVVVEEIYDEVSGVSW